VVLLRTTQTLAKRNLDNVAHNTNVSPPGEAQSGPLVDPSVDTSEQFTRPRGLPTRMACNVHAWEQAWVLIRDDPYMAKTDADGRFEIKHLPAGEHRFRLWHEQCGVLRAVRTKTAMSDNGGRLTLTIHPGDNRLGDVPLSPEMLSKPTPLKD
jgi:hypothetical protein